ncbi:MAG TPA: hypothetical protein VM389_12305 [Phycisphaerae bacterium]|nr:hypothetical protein [Phycisphaerae bacterium]
MTDQDRPASRHTTSQVEQACLPGGRGEEAPQLPPDVALEAVAKTLWRDPALASEANFRNVPTRLTSSLQPTDPSYEIPDSFMELNPAALTGHALAGPCGVGQPQLGGTGAGAVADHHLRAEAVTGRVKSTQAGAGQK